jgi:DnaJ-class molecular chaperone
MDKNLTSDLFGCPPPCSDCDGSGVIVTELTFTDDKIGKKISCGEREDECESCNGSGVTDASS